MADLSDVEKQLLALIAGWIYPNGTSEPSVITVNGSPVPVKVSRGWPVKTALAADLAANVANVSVFSQPGSERNVSRFPRQWKTLSNPAPSIVATVSGQTVTFSGAISTPQNIAVIASGEAFLYAVQPDDTLSTIASGLAALINSAMSATSSGAVLTVPSAIDLSAAVGGQGTVVRDLRRQERLMQITVWCNTYPQRDAVAAFVDGKFAGQGQDAPFEFFDLPDGFTARFLYVRTLPIDRDELSGAFRRDLIYSIEYSTTETQTATQIVTVDAALTPETAEAAPVENIVL